MTNKSNEDITDPTEAALMARITRYFHDVIRSLHPKERLKLLSSPNNIWTLLEALALAPHIDSPELRVRLRGAIARRKLLEQGEGVLSPVTVGELLGVSRQVVGLRRKAGKLLGVFIGDGYMYPAWQFRDTDMVPGIEEVFAILGDADPMTKVVFFLSHDQALRGKRPIDLLLKGDIKQVSRAAQTYGHQGAI